MIDFKIQRIVLASFTVMLVVGAHKLFPDIGLATSIGLVVALSNIKAFPFVWHFRILFAFLSNSTTSKFIANNPRHLFEPHVSTSHTPLLEIDYNLHKSNSTYFSDLDISRSSLLLSLFRGGLSRLKHDNSNAPCTIALGGAACNFHRPIPPLARYRIVSRILCWDHKWLYVATQFYAVSEDEMGKERGEVIYATGLARYVVKAGRRITVQPENLIDAAGLLGGKNDPRREEAEGRCKRALQYVQGFAAMDKLRSEFAVES